MTELNIQDEQLGLLIKEKFYSGLLIKNYRELCLMLNLSNNGGTQKEANLKRIQRFCRYERQGYKYIIKEIFDTPKDKEYKRGNNSKYVKLIETLLLNEFIIMGKDELFFTKMQLFECLGMVNHSYRLNCYRKKEFLKELQSVDDRVKLWHIRNAYSNSKRKLEEIIKSALNSLMNRELIEYCPNVVVAKKDGEYILVTNRYEINTIIKCETIALKKLNCKNLNEVMFNSNKNININRYNNIVNEQLQETLGYDYAFRAYRIKCNEEFLQQGLEENINQLKKTLNNKIIDFLVNRAEKDLKKNKEDVKNKKTSFTYNNDYVDIQKFILTKILNIDEKYIDEFIDVLEQDSEVHGLSFSSEWI